MANSKPRVLIAASIYPPDAGGPALHAKAQYEGFKERGVGVGLVALAHYRSWPIGVRHFLYLIRLLSLVNRYDVVYAHDAVGAGIPALLAARAFSKKFLVRVGGDLAWERKAEKGETELSMNEWYKENRHSNEGLFKLSRWLLERADAVIVPSVLLKNLYVDHYGLSEDKIAVIPNPMPAPSGAKSGNTERTIIYASRLVAYKNLSSVLEVLAEVLPSYQDLKFVVMGDGPERQNLEALVKQLGISRNIVFTGSVSQSEVLSRTTPSLFVIAPALTEFNPNYILQGIALGKPFLISGENGLPFEVPKDFVFDPRSKSELKQRILALLSTEGYEKAVEEVRNIGFSMTWGEVLDANLKLIESVSKK